MCMLRALCARVSLNPFSQSSDACFSSWFVLASLHHWTSDSSNSRYGIAHSHSTMFLYFAATPRVNWETQVPDIVILWCTKTAL